MSDTVVYSQPAYGVQMLYGPAPEVQPAYGVQITTVQPKYGVNCPSTTGHDISITLAQLEDNIARLKKSINALKSSWDVETRRNVSLLHYSWIGKDCQQYTIKLSQMNSKVQSTLTALQLLCSTFEQARDMVASTQNATTSSIRNM